MVRRNMFSLEYKDQKADLLRKKEVAFNSKDLKKWEVDQEKLPISKLDLLNDRETAMRYMFTMVGQIASGHHRHSKSARFLGLLQRAGRGRIRDLRSTEAGPHDRVDQELRQLCQHQSEQDSRLVH